MDLYLYTFDKNEFPKSIGDRISQAVAYLRSKGAAEAEHLLAVLLGYAKESEKAKQKLITVMTGGADIKELQRLAKEVNYDGSVSELSKTAISELHSAAQISPLALRSPKALKSLHEALQKVSRFSVDTDEGTSNYLARTYIFTDANGVSREQCTITNSEKHILVGETVSKEKVEFNLKQLESLHKEGKLRLFVETPLVIM